MEQGKSNRAVNGAGHRQKLKKVVARLIQELQTAVYKEGGMEAQAVRYLARLSEHLESGQLAAGHESMEQLKIFWLRQVPWCSALSRSLEKIIMLHDEMTRAG